MTLLSIIVILLFALFITVALVSLFVLSKVIFCLAVYAITGWIIFLLIKEIFGKDER